MDTSTANRAADHVLAAKAANRPVPAHIANLPEETHIVTGSLEGNGPVALVSSDKAVLSARVIKLERTSSGGIDYQVAIYVQEPTPVPVLVVQAAEDPQYLAAVAYFVETGMSDQAARIQVNRFGVARVLAQRDRELDAELAKVVASPEPPAPEAGK